MGQSITLSSNLGNELLHYHSMGIQIFGISY